MAYGDNNYPSAPQGNNGAGNGGSGNGGSGSRSSGKDRLIQAIIAIAAVAALVVSVIGLVSSRESSAAAKQSANAAAKANQLAAQANQLAARAISNTEQQQMNAQASKITFDVYQTGNQYFVQIINLSASSIRDVFFTYGSTSTAQFYTYVNLVKPCFEWQAVEQQQFNLWLYFEDSAGNYWEIDPSGNLSHLADQPGVGNLTQKTSTWPGQDLSLSCVS